MHPHQILGIVGWSGSGKTTLIEALLPLLSKSGLRVNVIKHSHHDVMLEPPHKDSARLRAAGASEVLLSTPYRYALMRELRGDPEPTLEQLLARLTPTDLTLVEGYKWTPIAKLEVFRPSLGKAALYPEDESIVAVVSDVPVPSHLPRKVTWLNLGQPHQVVEWLLLRVTAHQD